MELDDDVIKLYAFDGQNVYVDKSTALYEVGNFLGNGAAGNVYECENTRTHEHFALKVLNPLGYKMQTAATLRKFTAMTKGKCVTDAEAKEVVLSLEHLWWLVNGSTKQYVAAYYSERHKSLKELSLSQCIQLWGTNPVTVAEDESGRSDSTMEVFQTLNGPRICVPAVHPKYADFIRRRRKIFREIRNMQKISAHINVIRLEKVLELIQESSCHLFLVMELANGGELFDRIEIDCGTREDTAKFFFQQLLQGVKHCHDQGVCHRDLKPENLLLQDADCKTTLKIADFGFSARFASAIAYPESNYVANNNNNHNGNRVGEHTLHVLKSVVGSPYYVAPEVLQARGYDGPKADIWSMGVILYAMLAGNLPFEQELSTCKRFRLFCKWARENSAKNDRFWESPGLEFPSWLFPAQFSGQARSLIVAMLHPDPEQRISVEEAMVHPLIRPLTLAASARIATQQLQQPSSFYSSLGQPVARQSTPELTMVVTPVVGTVVAAPAIPTTAVPAHIVPPSVASSVATSSVSCSDESCAMEISREDATDDQVSGTVRPLPEATAISPPDSILSQVSVVAPTVFVSSGAVMRGSAAPATDDEYKLGLEREELTTRRSESSYRENDGDDEHSAFGAEDETWHSTSGQSDSSSDSDTEEDEQFVLEDADCSNKSTSKKRTSRTELDSVSTPTSRPPKPSQPSGQSVFGRGQEYPMTPQPSHNACSVVNRNVTFASSPYSTDRPMPPPAPPAMETPNLDDLLLSGGEEELEFNWSQSSPESGVQTPTTPRRSSDDHHGNPPSFNDVVKRSTRFTTAVSATEVLEKVECVLEEFRRLKTVTPIGVIGKIVLLWDRYRLEVWGVDVSGPPLCALQLYQMSPQESVAASSSPSRSYFPSHLRAPTAGALPFGSPVTPPRLPGQFPSIGGPSNLFATQSTGIANLSGLSASLVGCSSGNLSAPSVAASSQPVRIPSAAATVGSEQTGFSFVNSSPCSFSTRGGGGGGGGGDGGAGVGQSPPQLVMCEFVRGQIEIFAFKKFYMLIRQRLSELVKRDYRFKLFDPSSPMVDSALLRRFQT